MDVNKGRVFEIYNQIASKISGRYAMWPMDAVGWYWCNQQFDKPTLEIGTAFGGSAIVAAFAKRDAGFTSKVYAVDPLNGYYGKGKVDNISSGMPSLELVKNNLARLGVEDMIELVPAFSPNIPNNLKEMKFGTVLIDGSHETADVLNDWKLAKSITEPGAVIFFHDIHKGSVLKAYQEIVNDYFSKVVWEHKCKGDAFLWLKSVKGNEDFGSFGIIQKQA